MFEKALERDAADSLALLGSTGLLRSAYLAGGTAAALHLGHRISVDFDFFTPAEFSPRDYATQLAKIGAFNEETAEKGTITGKFQGVRFSLFLYEYPLLFETEEFKSLRIADIRDISAMKVDAIAGRGAKRDFIDLYFICRSGYGLKEILGYYDKKYGTLASNRIHIYKSLVYFDDAEQDSMPHMLAEGSWDIVKEYFRSEIKNLTR
jgi:hypothetical protein